MRLIPKNWAKFQHYKDRCPPWIKLHRDLLNDRKFICLPTASKALAPLLWLLASECKDGTFDASVEELEFRLRMSASEIKIGLKALIDNDFFLDASTMLAPSRHIAIPETETETETETEKRTAKVYDARSHLVSLGVDKLIADDWLKTRKLKKLASTETAINAVVNEANKSGKSLADIIRICCEQGWGGFKASWELPASPSAAGQSLREMCV